MIKLAIYSLDDVDYENVVALLHEGKHVVGRGGILNVADRRVSRKHASIDVSDSKVTLTSIHPNPCFFKSAQSKTLIIVKQNEQTELGDGDQFALLPEDCWFKIKITKDFENGDVEDIDSPAINKKRFYEGSYNETNLNTTPKKIKLLTNESTINNGGANNVDHLHQPAVNSIKEIEFSKTSNNSKMSPKNNDKEVFKEHDEALDTTESKTSPKNNDNKEVSKKTDDEPLDLNKSEASSKNDDHGKVSKENDDEALDPNKSVTNDNEGIFKEDESLVSNNQQNTTLNEDANKNSKEDPLDQNITSNEDSNKDIKKEPLEIEDNSVTNTSQHNGNSTNDNKPIVKTEEESTAAKGETEAKVKRERCWYGDSCYRKNPNHRETFSHPGDQDYELDPNDNRPDCPFGVACYRQNLDHRRQYKHVAGPAPKPSNNVFVSMGCPYCLHCRNGLHRKADYESDVDEF